jgi:hypothetical protein
MNRLVNVAANPGGRCGACETEPVPSTLPSVDHPRRDPASAATADRVGSALRDPAVAAAIAAAEAERNFRRECGGSISDTVNLLGLLGLLVERRGGERESATGLSECDVL